MAHKEGFVSVKPYLWHAIGATAAVVVLPIALVLAFLYVLDPDPPVLIATLAGVLLAIAVIAIGSGLWSRRPASIDVAFSELMLWRWARRRRAEEELSHGARLLGLDRSGTPIDDVRITPEQQLQVLKDLTAALESKDPYTHGHSQRVERHTYRTGATMGLAAADLEDLRKAASLHDVGKIRVPDRILRKAGPLTPDERLIVEEHAVVGAWMVSSVGNADVIAAVRHHHEKWDGTGYPDGLAGSDIPLYARIIAVADAYDAITSTRPYRASSGRDDAVVALRAGVGTQFDPEVVEAFVSALPSRVPVAAGLFILLGGPSRLLRQIALWFRRLGVGSLTPAAGATGAAIVLGASVFTPSVVTQGASSFQRQPAVVHHQEDEADPVVVHDHPANDDKKPAEPKHERHAPPETSVLGDTTEAAPGTTTAPEPPPAEGNGGTDQGGDGGGDHKPQPDPTPPVVDPEPTPTPEPPEEGPDHKGGDPQPDHGHDCDEPKSDKHMEKHCGA
ncbi:MAG TPA: HD-GYP domain-containing protein [Actinomycetota bacterium]|nr:HD-GYP domain-containing protein [Actinomycetota bacterium]